MALYWTIDPAEGLVSVVADGAVTGADIDRFLADLDACGAHGFPKVVNALRADAATVSSEVLDLAVRFRERAAAVAPGPIALVLGAEVFRTFGPLVGALAAADRSVRVFDDPVRARNWLETCRKRGGGEAGIPQALQLP